MFSFKYFIKLIGAYFLHFKFLILGGVLLGLVVFFAVFTYFQNISGVSHQVIGVTGKYHTEELPNFILNKVSSGLTKVSENGEVVPDLAKKWLLSEDGLTWTFELRDDKKWQDGKVLQVSDLSFNFRDVEVVNNPVKNEIEFKLKDKFMPFPSVLVKPVFKKGLLGTGDWEVNKISFQGSYVNELKIVNGKDTVLYKFYPTTEQTKTAFKLGKVDSIVNIFNPQPFDSWDNIKINQITDTNQVVVLFFDVADPILSDKTFRQALMYAIEKDYFQMRAISPVAPNSWAYNPQVKSYEFDSERAKTIIEELPDEVKQKLDLRLTASSSLLSLAEEIAKDWSDVGVNTNIQITTFVPDEFQIYLTIMDIPIDPDQYYLWHTTQMATNLSNYSNLRIDKLLEDGRAEKDQNERRKIYLDFQRFLLEDLPAGFLYHPTYYTISR